MQWYYEMDGAQQRPVSESELNRLISAGTISPDTRVWCQGMSDWVPRSELAGVTADKQICSGCGELKEADSLILAGELVVCSDCKDAVLQRMREGIPASQDAHVRATREEHLKREASIRGIGTLYILMGVLFGLGSLTMIGVIVNENPSSAYQSGVFLGVFCVYLVLSVAMVSLGFGYRKLRSWVRIPGGILAGIGLLGFPVGTIINAYILYLIFTDKGKTVLSKEYKAVIEATPDMKYRSSRWVFLLLGLVIAVMLFGALSAL